MNVRDLKITIKDRKQVFKEAAKAFEKIRKREKMVPHHELSFQNIETLRKILTDKRIELLQIIKAENPESIYELAQLVHRDLKSVHTDVEVLAELGLVSLEEQHDERKRVRPIVDFDRINVEIAI